MSVKGVFVPMKCGMLAASVMFSGIFKSQTVTSEQLPYAGDWLDALAESKGPDEARRIFGRIEERYGDLYSRRQEFKSEPIRTLQDKAILPLVAAYEILIEETGSATSAEEDVVAMLAAISPQFHIAFFSGGCSLTTLYDHMPFTVFRSVAPFILKSRFPYPYFNFEVRDSSIDSFSYSTDRCFALESFVENGARELVNAFCLSLPAQMNKTWRNDLLFEHPTSFIEGDDSCAFNWKRVA